MYIHLPLNVTADGRVSVDAAVQIILFVVCADISTVPLVLKGVKDANGPFIDTELPANLEAALVLPNVNAPVIAPV